MKMFNSVYLYRNDWNKKYSLKKQGVFSFNCRSNGFTYSVNQEAVNKILDMFGKCSLINLKRASQVTNYFGQCTYVRRSVFSLVVP